MKLDEMLGRTVIFLYFGDIENLKILVTATVPQMFKKTEEMTVPFLWILRV